MKVAVVGAGVGGLALATLLHRAGHEVCLWERFSQPRPVGSGLIIQPVGLAVLDALGVGAEARALGAPIVRMLGHLPHGPAVLNVSYRSGQPGLAMHRSALFDVLWRAAQTAGVPVRTSTSVHEAAPAGPRRVLRGAQGSELDTADLVVDASGAGSALSPLRAAPLAYGALWGTVRWPEGSALPSNELRQRYRAASRMAGVLPLGRLPGDSAPRAALFWSLPADQLARWGATDLGQWRADVLALWPEIEPFVAQITQTDQMTPARYSHGTLRTPFAPGLVFIGDSAHRASPQLGQGANMALLDAYALAAALRNHPLEAALARYAATRRWHVRAYQALSAIFTPMYQSSSRVLPPLRDHLLAPCAQLPGVRQLLTTLVSGDLLPPLGSGQLALPAAG